MVVACKDYITEKGIKRLWDFQYSVISQKIQDALDLYKEYDSGFQVEIEEYISYYTHIHACSAYVLFILYSMLQCIL